MSIKDFRAKQLRTSRIIGSGSVTGGSPHTLIYSASKATNFEGGTPAAMLDGVGKDVGLFVSGTTGQRERWLPAGSDGGIYGQGGVTLIGGDLHISGNISADGNGLGGTTGSFNEPLTGGKFVTTASVSLAGAALPAGYSGPATKAFELTAERGSGLDTFFYVSGSKTIPENGFNRSQQTAQAHQAVSVFGGDVVVSGTLYAERQVIEVDQLATGSLLISGSLFVSRSIEVNQGMTVNAGQGSSGLAYNKFAVKVPSGDALSINDGGENVVVNEGGVDTIDFRVESNLLPGAILVDASENKVALGVGSTNLGSLDSTTSVYLAGTPGGKAAGTARSTVEAQGDVDIKGSLHLTGNLSVGADDADFNLYAQKAFNVHLDARDGDAGTAWFGIRNNSGLYQSVFYEHGETSLNFSRNASGFFTVRGNSDYGLIFTDPSENAIALGAALVSAGFNWGNSFAPDDVGHDVKILLSGTLGGKGGTTRNTTLNTGDLVVSGTIYTPTLEALAGNLNIKARDNNADIAFMVDDGGSDRTVLTLDGSDFGSAVFTPFNGGSLTIDDAGSDGYHEFIGNGASSHYRYSSVDAATTHFVRYRGDSQVFSVVQDGDDLGEIQFKGYDGASVRKGAEITARVDGTPGFGDMPGKLFFSTTPDGAVTPVERLTIKQDGKVGIGTTYPSASLDVFGNGNNSQVFILSGSGAKLDSNESLYQDLAFFVSGSTTSRGTSTKGTALFGGDLVASGTIYTPTLEALDGNLNIKARDNDADIIFTVDDNGVDRAVLTIDGSDKGSLLYTPFDGGSLVLDDDGTDGYHEFHANGFSNHYRYSNSSMATTHFNRYRGSVGASSAVADGDGLGEIKFKGFDGSAGLREGAIITAEVDGAVGVGDMPGRLVFGTTPDGSHDPVTRLTIKQDGKIGIGTGTPAGILDIKGDGTSTQVFIMSGSGAKLDPDESSYPDVAFFVSGAIGSKGTSTKGVAIFGGDVVISGTLHGGSPLDIGSDLDVQGSLSVAEEIVHATDPNTKIVFKSDRVVIQAGGSNAVDAAESGGNRLYLGGGLTSGGTPFDQVLFMSGAGDSLSPNEQNFTDTAFFVSGAVGSKDRTDLARRGAAAFGGDLIVSGVFYPGGDARQFISADGTDLTIDSNDNIILENDSSFQVRFGSAGTKPVLAAYFNDGAEGRGTVINTNGLSYLDFRVESDNKAGAILVDGQTEQVAIGVNSKDASTAYTGGGALPADVALYVAGVVGGKGTEGVATFGGDLHISGNLTVDGTVPGGGGGGGGTVSSGSFNEPVVGGVFVTTASLSLAGGLGFAHAANTGRADTFFFVSGSANADDDSSNIRKSVFGGDVVMSGSLMVNRGQPLGNRVTITEDGKVGIGSDTPAYKLSVGGSMDVGDSIIHKNDTDTFMQFADDLIEFTVGNEQLLSLAQVDGGQDAVKIGDGGDVDLQVRALGDNHAIYVRGDNAKVGIGTNNPTKKLHVEGDVHVHGTAPIVSIQRDDNADDSTLSFLGQHGNTGAIAHLANTNDLVFKTHNGSTPEEMLRLGSHYGVLNRQVILLSGSGVAAASMQPKEAADINFFASGSIGSRTTATRGTGVFGGDLVVSGSVWAISPGNSLYVNEYIRSSEDFNTYIRFNGADTLQFGAGGTKFAQLFEGGQDLWQVNPDAGDIDFEVFGNAADRYMIKTNAAHTPGGGAPAGSVLILSGGDAQSIDQATKLDVSFFVSGAMGSNDGGKQFGGNAVFGGDLVVSGNFHMDGAQKKLVFGDREQNIYLKRVGPVPGGTDHALDLAGDVVRFGKDTSEQLGAPGTDCNFQVSGSINSRSTATRGTAVFGGDVVISGSLYTNQTEILNVTYLDTSNSLKEFIPLAGTSNTEVTNPGFYSLRICPFNGRLIKVLLRSNTATTGMGSTVVGLHRGVDGDASTDLNNTPQATVTANVPENTVTEFDFSATNAIFQKNEVIAISVDPTNNHGQVTVSVVLQNEIL